jgi:hypothetical protein
MSSTNKQQQQQPATASLQNQTKNLVNTNLLNELTQNLGLNCEEFITETFDFKKYTNAIIKTKILGEHLQKLSLSTNLLDKEIREQISLHHEDLLSQAINIETLEEMLDMVHTRIISLKSTSERLRVKIVSPYNELNLRITQLSRLQSACDMLRRIKGIIHHSAKLKVQIQNGVKDIVKSSQSLNELEFLLKNFDYNGIDIIEKDIHFIHKSKRDVEEQANNLFEVGLLHQNQTQIGTALQVFFNLGCLISKIIEMLKSLEVKFSKNSNDLLNPTNISIQATTGVGSTTLQTSASAANLSAPGRSSMPQIGSMSQFRAALWANIEKLMDNFYDTCSQIVQMQKILIKKKDLLTNSYYNLDANSNHEIDLNKNFKIKVYLKFNEEKFIDFEQRLIDTDNISTPATNIDTDNNDQINKNSLEFLYSYYDTLIDNMNKNLQQSCLHSNHFKQTLQNEYPKLLKLKNDLWLRLIQLNPLIEKYIYPQPKQTTYQTSYELMNKCFIDLENSYLTRSLNSLFDPINLIFCQSQTNIQAITGSNNDDNVKMLSHSDLEQYFKAIQTQLQLLQYDLINKTPNLNIIQRINDSFSYKIVKNIIKSIQMFINKCEQYINQANPGSKLMNLSDYHGSIECINLINEFYELLQKLISDTKQQFSFEINDIFKTQLNDMLNNQLLEFMRTSLAPIYQYTNDCIEAIILTMHSEDFSSNTNTSSLYLKELQQVLGRICKDYLLLYNCKSIIVEYLKDLSIRLTDLFIRHSMLIKSNSNKIRRHLFNDLQQIEFIITNNLFTKLNDLGVYYKYLKSYRHLLQLTIDFDDDVVVGFDQQFNDSLKQISDSLPSHVILHYLISTFAPNELRLPNQMSDWSHLKYSQWLDKHLSEKERLLILKNTIDDYVGYVKQKNEKQFVPVYPLLVDLLEKGLQCF